MVKLRKPNRLTRGSGFSMKYFVLIVAAMVTLVFWAFQRLYSGSSSGWLLAVSIGFAAAGFGWAIWDLVSIWRNARRDKK